MTPQTLTITTLTAQHEARIEENYWRGYIDAKVEDLGKTRTHHPTDVDKITYRDTLVDKHLPTNDETK